jgi:hypothetical protein
MGRQINFDGMPGTWNVYVYTYDGSKDASGMKIYWGARQADNSAVGGTSYTGLCIVATNVYLGVNRNPVYAFDGEIANVMVETNTAWTQTEVMSYLINMCTNIGYDFSAGNYLIWSNSVYENTLTSTVDCDSSFAGNDANACVAGYMTDGTNAWRSFNGSSQEGYLRGNNDVLEPLNSNYAFSAWVNITNNPGAYGGVLELGAWYGNSYFRAYYDTANKPVFWCRDTTGGQVLNVSPTNVLELNKWYNWTGTWNGSNVAILYLDGKVIGAATNASFGQITGFNAYRYGRITYSSFMGMNGYLDEIRLWRGVDITPYIGSIYTNSKAKFGR